MPVKEAREMIGVSREKMRKLIAAGRFTIYENPRDAREKLIDTQELEEYLKPKPKRPTPPDPA